MALYKMFQSSLGLLLLGHLLLGHVTSGSDQCESTVTKKFGEKVALRCRQSTQNVAWIFCPRNSGAYAIAYNCNLASPAVGKYRLEKTDDACNLVIDNLTPSHLGTYTCQDIALKDYGHSVELANTNENLAFQKPTIQSSTYGGTSAANLAVDGTTDGIFTHASCTEAIAPEWWAVDLGQETSIGRVRITNRADCCPERLQRFFIALTNVSPFVTAPQLNNQSSICKFFTGYPPAGTSLDIFCEPNTLPGRYLFVYMKHAEYLTICELEAYYK